ncbi:endo-1,4-beta-xylanase [Litoribacter alkaliphilus]|uniref:Endo-1,4-beta-xylanase n=1 Tax=Litoribacter ruber TaxID=702568 RepID=A0AAP2G2V8_9BACT|nr:endo-1,4-beta-xylanase [Litoribacter alkaliphilus]MBS9522740.1 endo-1,4-beta-xylanase [Litoribacter alkaliphilus]
MKLKYIWIYAIGFASLTSCADIEALEFHVDQPESVAMQEEINAYGHLLDYINTDGASNFLLGTSINASDYTSRGVSYRLINNNFNEISTDVAMTHGAVLQSNGDLNLVNVLSLLESAHENGLSLFGNPLVWHSNQNSAYLNGLLAPLVVNSPPFANSLDKSGLTDGSFQGWDITNGSSNISIVEYEGMGGQSNAIQLRSSASSSAPADLQLGTPAIPVIPGNDYEVVVYIKSDIPGEGRISFQGLVENTPQIDWMNTGEVTETFNTNLSWSEIRFLVRDFQGDSFRINFDLGYEPNVSYHIDLENLYVYDTDGEPIINNLITNGDFESGIAWGGWGNNSERGVTPDGQGVNNSGRALYVNNPSTTGGFWEVQTAYDLSEPLQEGETYNLSFWVKGDAEGVIRPEMQSPDWSSNGFGMVYVTEEWQHVNLSTTMTANDRQRLIISYGEFAGTVYMDEFVLSSSALQGGTTTIVERTPAEKNQIATSQLENWIAGMVTATAPYVTSWNVVNQPMDDNNPSQLRSGQNGAGNDQFFWQDYIGKDYGVLAFEFAREHGNNGDLLYISDNNLENNLDKTRGLIEYVNYLETNGALVDGIAAQMNLSLSSNTSQIAEMFTMLAASGKLVKVTHLKVALGPGPPSMEVLDQQSDMYYDVLNLYKTHVPAQQRGGISMGGITDGADYGLLWSPNLNRKPAYAGLAEGLKE